MKYKLDLSPKLDLSAPPITGARIGAAPQPPIFFAWQPSTWPATPTAVDERFVFTLKRIFEESILGEIANVISDATKCNGDLQYRGHVVAISLMCALDAIASYGYRGEKGVHLRDFIASHFPADYQPYAAEIYGFYRCSLVHSWNLFEASIYPGNEQISNTGGALSFGLLNFFNALTAAAGDFLEKLETDVGLQANTLGRYERLRSSAKP
jgi:hypothetical protein